MAERPRLLLCTGLQSSGSTLVAWCFLQRPDTDGVLDASNDILPTMPNVKTPHLFCKMTISSFTTLEMMRHYEDAGFEVVPLLVVRDARSVFRSLLGKPYGNNGTTAEDPPLRMRLRRFLSDWTALAPRCATIRYESLVTDAKPTLEAAARTLGLGWHQDMTVWPKRLHDLADPAHGSPTLRKSLGNDFASTVKPSMAVIKADGIPADDLAWLETEFASFNEACCYPLHIASPIPAPPGRADPAWTFTRRSRKERSPVKKLLDRIAGKRRRGK